MEAISHAGTAIGILASDGIVLAAEKKLTVRPLPLMTSCPTPRPLFFSFVLLSLSPFAPGADVFSSTTHPDARSFLAAPSQSKLLEPSKSSEKMYMVDEHVAVAVAGITADANILINQARLHAQRYRFTFVEPQPVEQLVQSLCDEKQAYTQYGGLRPFGVSMLYAGWDKTYGFQLYQSDPSGNYNGWKATCIGMNHQSATSLMKQEYKTETIPLADALQLAVKVLTKTCDATELTPDKFDLATLTLADGKVVYHEYTAGESQALLDKHKADAASADA
jgi:20S proteasome subunit alpha 3